jgi:hypothetical protein
LLEIKARGKGRIKRLTKRIKQGARERERATDKSKGQESERAMAQAEV